MIIQKMLRLAEKLGLDKEELLEMTVLDAGLLIEETMRFWTELENDVK